MRKERDKVRERVGGGGGGGEQEGAKKTLREENRQTGRNTEIERDVGEREREGQTDKRTDSVRQRQTRKGQSTRQIKNQISISTGHENKEFHLNVSIK